KCAGRAADQSRHAVSGYSAAPRGNGHEKTKAKRKAERIVARCWQSTSPSWKAGEGGCSSARNSSVCVEGRQSRRREALALEPQSCGTLFGESPDTTFAMVPRVGSYV